MTRERYEAAIERQAAYCTYDLEVAALSDESADECHVVLDALALLRESIKAGNQPWNGYAEDA